MAEKKTFEPPKIPQLVTETSSCQKIVKALCRTGKPVAVDAEGVCLGPEGSLTLLQVGTYDGEVFIFDVQLNPDLFTIGRLKTLLEHDDVLKVIHGCSSDSGALYHQFGVRLTNVFDPQMAHLLIEQNINEVEFPHKIKLQAMVEKYGGRPNLAKLLREEWIYVEDYWTRRPLTRDMIAYAAGDVTALIPEVYEEQNRLLEENGLLGKFRELVEEEIEEHIEPDLVREARDQRRQDRICRILKGLGGTFSGQVPHPSQLSNNQLDAVSYMRDTDPIYRRSPFFQKLKRKQIIYNLETWHKEFLQDEKGFRLYRGQEKFVHALSHHKDLEIKRKARQLQSDLSKVVKVEKVLGKSVTKKKLTFREKKWLVELPEENVTPQLYDIRKDMIKEFEKEIDSIMRKAKASAKQKKLTNAQKELLNIIPNWMLQTDSILRLKAGS